VYRLETAVHAHPWRSPRALLDVGEGRDGVRPFAFRASFFHDMGRRARAVGKLFVVPAGALPVSERLLGAISPRPKAV
jgi:hypothetical protein